MSGREDHEYTLEFICKIWKPSGTLGLSQWSFLITSGDEAILQKLVCFVK